MQFDSYVFILQMACKHHLVLSRNGPKTKIFGPPRQKIRKNTYIIYIAQKPPIIYFDVLAGIVFVLFPPPTVDARHQRQILAPPKDAA